ncbi:MAG: hypothetical protein J5966_06125 [Lachnospiraceae bacterium]|nr:hypothetical protein [Lachnospiraceae bacterium]
MKDRSEVGKPDIRLIVLDTLMKYEKEGKLLKPLLLDVQGRYAGLDRRDRAFIGALTEGVAERLITLDWIIDQVSSRKAEDIRPVIRMIIRMGTYQLIFMDHVPDNAAVNESVKITHIKHMDGLKGFVNGVLRGVIGLRDRGIDYPDTETECSVPVWIAEMLRKARGEEAAEKMMRQGISESSLYLRVNQNATDAGRLVKILEDEGITADRIKAYDSDGELPYSLVVRKGGLVPLESESFNKGLYSIQDLSSQRAVYELWDRIQVYINHKREIDINNQSKVDINVYDMCSAPGGKACFLAELFNRNRIRDKATAFRIRACDISEAKLDRIRENIERTGIDGIETEKRDAASYDPALREKADIIIADLPCSGLGVMGRKVDIKYRVKPGDIEELCELQKRMLKNAADYLKSRGLLLFSVCTVTLEETTGQAGYLESIGLHNIMERQILQGVEPGDGFYYSIWQKR